jgi:hypothetical protein
MMEEPAYPAAHRYLSRPPVAGFGAPAHTVAFRKACAAAGQAALNSGRIEGNMRGHGADLQERLCRVVQLSGSQGEESLGTASMFSRFGSCTVLHRLVLVTHPREKAPSAPSMAATSNLWSSMSARAMELAAGQALTVWPRMASPARAIRSMTCGRLYSCGALLQRLT